ncbi:hypothetical protein PF005_g4375 [Phytophthora fragariae]|uniref:Myb-like domain-containing protein n=1 Tax=Phytophthora fragariae TaxID=53985 RepID=A0A6A3U272_9STRA|nr:hypothetical protein PF003_g16350 [Phytophthora fragariae]KAE8936885.1 hypothetical protein PF009_g13204 [Phytophthora fragariae]KAE9008162.1 hypothetical protein PF011_g10816 [Phytophthora fragariae]KAE9109149.1 hypothetical protein PF007_g12365 [Phytophthora fragariae]KAE9121680.1 hypothetical protein PF010_g7009 [Phytophthora fragariae]
MGPKRRNFSAEEDLALLRQALSNRPFLRERGKTLAAWDALAAQLVSDANFTRGKLSGKTAQARFDKLVTQKRQQNAVALAASGVDEEETEKDVLLDELIALIDDHIEAVAAGKDTAKRKRDVDEEASLTARRLAMERLSAGEPPKKKNKEDEMKEFLLELKRMDAKEQKERREQQAALHVLVSAKKTGLSF